MFSHPNSLSNAQLLLLKVSHEYPTSVSFISLALFFFDSFGYLHFVFISYFLVTLALVTYSLTKI